jgi:hypothetical protein
VVQTIAGVGFELYQNQPNPFVNKTLIGFHLPEATEATLTIFDETGRMLFTQKGQFGKGYNAIAIDRALLNTTGMMYYKLETATDAATKKMIQTKLKSKLKERLLDSFFLLHFKEANFTSRQKAFFECYKKWATVMTLLSRNAKVIGIDQLERLLKHTVHFEFTELTLDILRVLRLQYSIVDGDIKKYEAGQGAM